ncbi:MAG TPA: formylglycine-generating enzyme family protein [Candidatus Polarisedimenticolaceae bacterium]|nr:formylglycine-generating enzyme family protein [Candidatus Polarisedimenticolaceae bacterium]
MAALLSVLLCVAAAARPDGMVRIPGGTFWMGSDDPAFPDARPVHRVTLNGFFMDRTEVTNAQFRRFVVATGHVTVAERPPRAEDYPGAPPENLVAGSLVFSPPAAPISLGDAYAWWSYVEGADWKHPTGPGSDLRGKDTHPVVHVAYEDAAAYCAWAGGRLPTEAEFEYAERGGLDRKRYAWGDTFRPAGKWMANTFQGHFPHENTGEDGFLATAPVGSFPANGFGLYDMAGNVWEWCSDWYRPGYDAPPPSGGSERVQKGGSFLCSDQYCARYMPGGRGKGEPDTGTNHLGFRCVKQERRR